MKTYERRAIGAFPYFKLATWDERNCTWKDGKVAYETEEAARRAAKRGKCRISRVDESSRADLEPFSA